MIKKDDNIILMFLDLEGTILNENTGDFEENDMFGFLKEIDNLQKELNSKAYMYIVSPMYMQSVAKILDKMDTAIAKYSINNSTYIKETQGATACIQNEMNEYDYLYDKISPFPKLSNTSEYDIARVGKLKYVQKWIDEWNEKIKLCIYCGNGRNDISAMEYVKNLTNGIAICPSNSRTEVKRISDIEGKGMDINGTAEALARLNKIIEIKSKSMNGENKINDER
jgi:hydroxymethylpyrimidine pyrophosphatase-like HAD family hydrolase